MFIKYLGVPRDDVRTEMNTVTENILQWQNRVHPDNERFI